MSYMCSVTPTWLRLHNTEMTKALGSMKPLDGPCLLCDCGSFQA